MLRFSWENSLISFPYISPQKISIVLYLKYFSSGQTSWFSGVTLGSVFGNFFCEWSIWDNNDLSLSHRALHAILYLWSNDVFLIFKFRMMLKRWYREGRTLVFILLTQVLSLVRLWFPKLYKKLFLGAESGISPELCLGRNCPKAINEKLKFYFIYLLY